MRKLLYFLGGCAAGALAMAAVQTWNECSESSSRSSGDDEENAVLNNETADSETIGQGQPPFNSMFETINPVMDQVSETVTQDMGQRSDSQCLNPQNMDLLGQQLAAGIITIVGQFMHQQGGQPEASAASDGEAVVPDFGRATPQG